MPEKTTLNMPIPLMNVVNVEQTIQWYQSIGFELIRTNHHWHPDSPINWAYLQHDDAHLMLNSGGTDNKVKGDFKLFFNTSNLDLLFQQIKDKVNVVFEPTDQFYGRREFEIQDINGFQLVFGQAIES